MSATTYRSQRIRSKPKSSVPLFFSYKRVVPYHDIWNDTYQFDWEEVYGYVFNTIFSLGQDASLWLDINHTTLGYLFTPFKTPKFKSHYHETQTPELLYSFSRRSTLGDGLKDLYYLHQTLTFFDLTRDWWCIYTLRALQTPFVRRDQFTWARNMSVWSYLSVHLNIQSLNLLIKLFWRKYLKFHNYWFEYVRLTPVLKSSVSIPFSAFLHDDLIRTTKATLTNRSTLTTCQHLAPLQTHVPISYDLSQHWNDITKVVRKSSSRLHSYKVRRRAKRAFWTKHSIWMNEFTESMQLHEFKNVFSYVVQKNHRQMKRNRRHKIYQIRNKCWHTLFKIHRSYPMSFKMVRYFRRSRVHRKFIPRTVRTIATYTAALQSISYKSLVNTPKFAYLLTRDSSIAAIRTSPLQLRANISKFHSLILSQLRLSSTYFNDQIVPTRSNILTSVLNASPISQQLTLLFTSRESFGKLILQNNTLLWKYSLSTLILRTCTYSLDYSFNYALTSIAYMMTYIIQNHIHLYTSTTARRSMMHSNLSVLHLEELYRSVLTYKTVDSKILRYYSKRYMRPSVFLWYYTSLIQFLEYTTGRKIVLNFGPFLETALTFTDRAKCVNWKRRILGFQRMLGPKIFIYEALEVLVISIRLKDPTFLANWIRAMLARISFWKYRVIFRYLKFLLQNLIKSSFDHFSFKGAKFRLKGKISVAGNARTRMVFYRIGSTSHTTMAYRIAYDLSYVHTFTGIQGFKIWFFY